MSKFEGFLLFVLGAGIGSASTYFVYKDICNKRLDEEVEQIKAAYDEKYRKTLKVDEEEVPTKARQEFKDLEKKKEEMLRKKPEYIDYSKIVKEEKYDEAKVDIEEEKEMGLIDGEIIIEPDNHEELGIPGFGMPPFDNVVFATIYSDGYLVDDSDHIIDIEQIGGKETLEHFGEGFDPELLHVRNTLYEIDYEIDKDERTYAEVSGKDPSELPELDS